MITKYMLGATVMRKNTKVENVISVVFCGIPASSFFAVTFQGMIFAFSPFDVDFLRFSTKKYILTSKLKPISKMVMSSKISGTA